MQKCQLIVVIFIVGIGLFGLNTLSAVEPDVGKEDIVAVVNGSVISKQDLEVSFNSYVQEVKTKIPRELTESDLSKIKSNIIEELINQKLFYQAAIKKNIQINEEQYKKEIAQLNEQLQKYPSFKAKIEKTNYSMEEIHSQIRNNLLINAFLKETFFDPTIISDKEIRAYYDNNKDKFIQPEQIRARHILIKPSVPDDKKSRAQALKKITEIQEILKTNKDFEALATEFSHCPSSKQGGDLDFFGKGQMVPAFEQAAFALEINEVSDIVETEFGYHLIKLTGKVAQSTMSFEQVKNDIHIFLKKEGASKKMEAFLDSEKKSGTIELFL